MFVLHYCTIGYYLVSRLLLVMYLSYGITSYILLAPFRCQRNRSFSKKATHYHTGALGGLQLRILPVGNQACIGNIRSMYNYDWSEYSKRNNEWFATSCTGNLLFFWWTQQKHCLFIKKKMKLFVIRRNWAKTLYKCHKAPLAIKKQGNPQINDSTKHNDKPMNVDEKVPAALCYHCTLHRVSQIR